MKGLDLLEKHMEGMPAKPPLHLWQPELSGDIDIVILENGDWIHQGGKIKRLPLVRLFSSILRREDDGEYYLVTPVEKWRIKVADTAFVVVDMDVLKKNTNQQQIIFTTNVEDKFLLSQNHTLSVTTNATSHEPHPKIVCEHGVTARLSRAVFYRLVDYAIERDGMMSVLSEGAWFELGRAS